MNTQHGPKRPKPLPIWGAILALALVLSTSLAGLYVVIQHQNESAPTPGITKFYLPGEAPLPAWHPPMLPPPTESETP